MSRFVECRFHLSAVYKNGMQFPDITKLSIDSVSLGTDPLSKPKPSNFSDFLGTEKLN